MVELKPQDGQQTAFFQSDADILIYGGAAGGGKTWSILAEPLRHIYNPGFGAVIFRRTTPEIMNEGGLWDESMNLYPIAKGTPKIGDRTWYFPSGASIQFAHMEHETDRLKWQGSQIALIEFDELTHFLKSQFWYLVGRNRSTCGIKPYIRATTNPDSESWVREFIDPFIDEEGFPNAECGKNIYIARASGEIKYSWNKEQLIKDYNWLKPEDVLSMTFIPSRLEDNKILMEKDPSYRGKLLSLPPVEQKRLLYGNWNVKNEEGRMFFDPIRSSVPDNLKCIAYLDPAFSANPNSDYSALCIGGKRDDKIYVKAAFLIKANIDEMYERVTVTLLKYGIDSMTVESNQAQVALIREFRQRGFNVRGVSNTKNKAVRIQDALGKNWRSIIFGPEVQDSFLSQILNYTSIPPAAHDDAPDSLAGLIESFTQVAEVRSLV